jgi:thioredoxin-like negative regulator of GroEL
MSPHDKSLSAEFKRRVGFGAVDASKNQELAGKYGVTALPTYVTFEDGKEVERLVGADPKALKDLLERYSKNAASAKAAPAKGASVKPAPALAKSAPARVAPAA